MTIFDVPKLSEDVAWTNVRATLARHPLLQRIYDETFLANLIRRRQSPTNHLLYWLVSPEDDNWASDFWSSVTEDLSTLEALKPLDLFRDKMRQEEKDRIGSWRTELWFPAWLTRNGVALTLEPPVGDKRPEFVTETDPPTWWEIKSPQDLEALREERSVLTDVQRRLKEIPEPFVLIAVRADLTSTDLPRAIKDIRAQIRAFAQSNGQPPATFESGGLVVEASARTKHRSTGFLGVTRTRVHLFQNEHAERMADRIGSAVSQLPQDGAGVVVIDRTLSDWSDETDAINSGYGEQMIGLLNGEEISKRKTGFFRPGGDTRVSAVVSYSRHPMHWKNCYELLFLHNPYARVPLPEHLFRFPGVRHMRRVELPDGCFRLEITGEGIPEPEV